MELTISELESRFLESIAHFRAAPSFTKKDKKDSLLSQADVLCRTAEGLAFLYQSIPQINEAGIFEESSWAAPEHLVAYLAGGTLLAGYPISTMEALSELRLLAIAEHRIIHPTFSAEQALEFLEDMLVANFELAYEDFSQRAWAQYPKGELKKIRLLFNLIHQQVPLERLMPKIATAIESLSEHRPIVVSRIKRMLAVIHKQLQLDAKDPDGRRLLKFVNVLYQPTPQVEKHPSPEEYHQWLEKAAKAEIKMESEQIGKQMAATGLVSDYQLVLLQYAVKHCPDVVPLILHLDAHGIADYERHEAFVGLLIQEFMVLGNKQAVYGLARVLQRNLLSRKVTWHALNRLTRVKIHPEVAKNLLRGNLSDEEVSPAQLLIGGALCALGQPLGLRQGNNPTCQSARGLSMWSRHAPGKLVNLLIDAATMNNVVFRYEGELIESAAVTEGLTRQFDYKLDPVSIVLVPHLDKIYNEMMKRAVVKHLGVDPHISVNPAFYGHWIQTGFLSVYNSVTGRIEKFENFVRVFYASFHPEYNGGHHLIYPVPLGIFITDANANMLGYHAISLLRIERSSTGDWRAYFFNPNSEGAQNWGQNIRPSVSGNGEFHGESSLPVYQFVSRVYAFHYNGLRLEGRQEEVPKEAIDKVEQLARESWGRKYSWSI
ncbi:MAG: hypothetical protein KDD02_08970 [Phaeodactylibacter sp.]|nr:hypothetical protein [Phaeodactylibacter sp.]MCB9303213.1 hypothetical protein [Lewinellaceae bacterium]